MSHAELPPESPIPELEVMRQCLEALELTPAARQTLTQALLQSTAQLQQRLEQVTQHAERLRLLGHLAANIAHEIRNPLNAVFLHADLLEEEVSQPTPESNTQMAESIAEIRLEVTRLYDVMQDYLTLARLAVVDREEEDLGSCLHDCALEMQERTERRGVTLRLVGMTRLGRVCLSKGMVRRAVLNLLQRALDAMPHGGTLTLRGRRNTTHAIVEFRDTGEGLPEEQADLLFEPFPSLDAAWTGLGLYVVREIISAHNGDIKVHSVPGQGTTITVMLPLAQAGARHPTA